MAIATDVDIAGVIRWALVEAEAAPGANRHPGARRKTSSSVPTWAYCPRRPSALRWGVRRQPCTCAGNATWGCLLYVALTRAMRKVVLLGARYRTNVRGQVWECRPSRFLGYLPPETVRRV